MKKFSNLKFKPHPTGSGKQAVMMFKNGYGVSVVRFYLGSFGYGSYTNNESEWELAVLKGNDKEWHLTYDTPITEDVIGHLSESQVSEIMKKVQEL